VPAAPTDSPSDSFFIEKEKADWDALKRKDKVAASHLLADDFVGMYDVGLLNKSKWLSQIDDQYSVDDYTITETKVLHPSPTTALLLYTATCKGTGAWAEFCSHTTRVSDLFVQRNGEWLDLFSQDTVATSGEQDETRVFIQVLAKEREIQEAQKHNDWSHFADLLSDDLVAIDEDGIIGKKELLEEIKAAEIRFSDYKMEEVRTIPDGNGAIVAYKQTLVGTEHGKPFTRHIYTHSHWQRRGDKWLLTMFQDSTTRASFR
jgi:ketosteroid isomerase-like protein